MSFVVLSALTMKHSAILLVSCPDSKGEVASIADFVYRHGGNILHADEHADDAPTDRREHEPSRDGIVVLDGSLLESDGSRPLPPRARRRLGDSATRKTTFSIFLRNSSGSAWTASLKVRPNWTVEALVAMPNDVSGVSSVIDVRVGGV